MLRRIFLLMLSLLTLVLLVQRSRSAETQGNRTPLTLPVETEAIQLGALPNASDSCFAPAEFGTDTSPDFPFPTDIILGGSTTVNNMTVNSLEDPASLSSCMLGNPTTDRGYRTAWYRFRAPADGIVYINVVPNENYNDDYDTVVAVYESPVDCSTLSRLTCNDDSNGFLSETTVQVTYNSFYYIQIADRNQAVNGTAQFNLEVWIEVDESQAFEQGWSFPASSQRSRHMAVVVDEKIYVIGGETSVGEYPFLDDPQAPVRTADVSVFDTSTLEWDQSPADMPLECDINGYSAADAIHLNGFIHVPYGFIGDNQSYSDTHCIYDIENDVWFLSDTTSPFVIDGSDPVAYAAIAGRPDLPDSNVFYITGGVRGPWFGNPSTVPVTASSDLYLYTSGTWLTSLPDMNTGRYSHIAAYVENDSVTPTKKYICVASGLEPAIPSTPGQPAAQLITDGECFDIISNVWVPTGPMNIPRFNAMTAIDADGNWYAIGGVNSSFDNVRNIERFNPATFTWEDLGPNFYLESPARAWPRGGFVGDDLWVVGGETTFLSGTQPIPTLARLSLSGAVLPSDPTAFVPLLWVGKEGNREPNDTFALAESLVIGNERFGDFNDLQDRFDIYTFRIDTPRSVIIDLNQIPSGDNYDLLLYDSNKNLLAKSDEIGNLREQIRTDVLPTGDYYIYAVVRYKLPFMTGTYRVIVR